MGQVGKIEKIEGNMAIISVKKALPCGDNCKKCAAGCYLNNITIQAKVSEAVIVGDSIEITSKNQIKRKNNLVNYGVPFLLFIGSISFVQLFLDIPKKDMISAPSAIASLIVSEFILKFYDKKEMKKNAMNYIIGKKI